MSSVSAAWFRGSWRRCGKSAVLPTTPTAISFRLDAAKKNIIGGFVLRLDSNQKLTAEVANIGFFNRPLDYLNTFTQKVEAVTREDVKRAFKARVDIDRLQTILVGGGAK